MMQRKKYIWDVRERVYHLPNGPYQNPWWSFCGGLYLKQKGAHCFGIVVNKEVRPDPMCPACLQKEGSEDAQK